MADWDDWEQADDAGKLEAPVIKTTHSTGFKLMTRKPTNTGTAPAKGGEGGLDGDDDIAGNLGSLSLHDRNRVIWDRANASEPQPIVERTDQSTRTEYVPEIRILKRPQTPVKVTKAVPVKAKTLAQREADYKAAREKIFGPSSSPPPPSTSSSSSSPPPPPSTTTTTSSSQQDTFVRSTASPGSPSSPRAESQNNPQYVKPIAFTGVPPRIADRSNSNNSSNRNSVNNSQNNTINNNNKANKNREAPLRQPRGPSAVSTSSAQGFIGIRKKPDTP